MFKRIKCVIIKEFQQVMRDPRLRIIIFISPLIQLIIFGYAANTDIQHVPTAVYDMDNTKESRDVIREFNYSRYFNVKYYIYNDQQASYLIDRTKVGVILHFQRGFGRDLQGNKNAEFQLIVDGTDANTANIILGYANGIMNRYNYKMFNERIRVFLKEPIPLPKVDVRDRAWFNENLLSPNYYIPGVISLIITIMTLLLTSMAIVREKEIGTMEQLIVSPIKPIELILGKITPFAIIALVDITMITLVGVLWFEIPLRGSILLLFIASTIYLLTTLGVGIFISTISATQQEAVMSTFLFFLPASLLSGFIFPIISMPKIVQYFTYLNPLRYYLVILRGLFLKGVGISILWPQLLILLIMGLGILALSSLRFKKGLA